MSRLTVPPNYIGSSRTDIIQAVTSEFNDIGIQVNVDGIIETRGGNDTVSGTATGQTGYGINDDGLIALGSGDDLIKGMGSFTGIQVTGLLDGGNKSDNIIGIADSTSFTHATNGIEVSGYLT